MYKERGWLANNLIIPTVMSNFGFMVALKELGIQHAAAKVGDRYVLELMKENGAVLGGEASGHVIFLNHHTTGDGILTALQLLAAMRTYGKPLSELAGLMKLAPQKIINVDVKNKPPLDQIPEMQGARAHPILRHTVHVPGHGRGTHRRNDRAAGADPGRYGPQVHRLTR
jgi:phosphoglucosamine mutase